MYDAQHRRWLPRNHPFKEATIVAFDYCAEHGKAPRTMKATYILVWAVARDTFVINDGKPARVDPVCIYGIK